MYYNEQIVVLEVALSHSERFVPILRMKFLVIYILYLILGFAYYYFN